MATCDAGGLLCLFELEDNAGNSVLETRSGKLLPKIPIWGGGGVKGDGGRINGAASLL